MMIVFFSWHTLIRKMVVQTNEVAENSCIAYVDSVRGAEEDYMEK